MLFSAILVSGQGWEYNASFYGWLDVTLGVRQQETVVEASFSDLAKYLDFAVATHFEARNPKQSRPRLYKIFWLS